MLNARKDNFIGGYHCLFFFGNDNKLYVLGKNNMHLGIGSQIDVARSPQLCQTTTGTPILKSQVNKIVTTDWQPSNEYYQGCITAILMTNGDIYISTSHKALVGLANSYNRTDQTQSIPLFQKLEIGAALDVAVGSTFLCYISQADSKMHFLGTAEYAIPSIPHNDVDNYILYTIENQKVYANYVAEKIWAGGDRLYAMATVNGAKNILSLGVNNDYKLGTDTTLINIPTPAKYIINYFTVDQIDCILTGLDHTLIVIAGSTAGTWKCWAIGSNRINQISGSTIAYYKAPTVINQNLTQISVNKNSIVASNLNTNMLFTVGEAYINNTTLILDEPLIYRDNSTIPSYSDIVSYLKSVFCIVTTSDSTLLIRDLNFDQNHSSIAGIGDKDTLDLDMYYEKYTGNYESNQLISKIHIKITSQELKKITNPTQYPVIIWTKSHYRANTLRILCNQNYEDDFLIIDDVMIRSDAVYLKISQNDIDISAYPYFNQQDVTYINICSLQEDLVNQIVQSKATFNLVFKFNIKHLNPSNVYTYRLYRKADILKYDVSLRYNTAVDYQLKPTAEYYIAGEVKNQPVLSILI